MTRPAGTAGYAKGAADFAARYESFRSADVLGEILDFVPQPPCDLIDIGAGTGRDAAFFAGLGHRVLAVEPTAEMRAAAGRANGEAGFDWLEDSLPDLAQTRALGRRFDFILLNAVWMHLEETEGAHAMKTIVSLAKPEARIAMTLRHGPVPEGRRMFPVTGEATAKRAAPLGFRVAFMDARQSTQPQNVAAGVTWTRLVLARP